ncbi:Hypothetical protein FKW44_006235, partial [Caligus rogercresseyi]
IKIEKNDIVQVFSKNQHKSMKSLAKDLDVNPGPSAGVSRILSLNLNPLDFSVWNQSLKDVVTQPGCLNTIPGTNELLQKR